MLKQDLRRIFLQKRLSVTTDEYHQLSRQLSNVFFESFNLAAISLVHTYLPIEKKKEPDTWPIIERLQKEFLNIQICTPRVTNDRLESFYFEHRDKFKINKWGISESHEGEAVPEKKIDLVLVPLLAFDTSGHRVGYGRGFYDRFLAACRPDCKKVGLSFFEPVNSIDTDPLDIPLTHCLSPSRLYAF